MPIVQQIFAGPAMMHLFAVHYLDLLPAALHGLGLPIHYCLSLGFAGRAQTEHLLQLVSSLFASLTFLFLPVVGDNEAGHINRIISRDLGYWLWLASALTMLVSNTLPYIKNLGKDTNL